MAPTNMDYLSLLINDEVNAVVLNKEFASQIEAMFAKDLANSKEITREAWEKAPSCPGSGTGS